jgi:hypothetical protein
VNKKLYELSRKLNDALGFMDKSKSNAEGNSQMLWNRQWDKMRELVCNVKDSLETISSKNSYDEKLNLYASLIDRQRLKNAIIYANGERDNVKVYYTQKIENDAFWGTIEIYISLRNNMWEHSVFYNRAYCRDFSQALLIARDDIHKELGWIA